jgi:hypothetical protein
MAPYQLPVDSEILSLLEGCQGFGNEQALGIRTQPSTRSAGDRTHGEGTLCAK